MRSYPTLDEFQQLFPSEEICIDFLRNHGVFYQMILCEGCNNEINLSPDRVWFRCYKRGCIKRGCRISFKFGTFFHGSFLSCQQILKLSIYWLSKSSVESCIGLTGHSSTTVCQFFCHFRSLISSALTIEDQIIGGESVEIAVDETKLGKRKYNRGHLVEGIWVLVGIELRDNGNIFLVPLPDRSEATLTRIIQMHVRIGSIIHTDMWRGYNRLGCVGYTHLSVNHSIQFINPETGACTNAAEGLNSGLKRRIPIRSRTRNFVDGHLFEYIWRRKYKNSLFEALVSALRDIHYFVE